MLYLLIYVMIVNSNNRYGKIYWVLLIWDTYTVLRGTMKQ